MSGGEKGGWIGRGIWYNTEGSSNQRNIGTTLGYSYMVISMGNI